MTRSIREEKTAYTINDDRYGDDPPHLEEVICVLTPKRVAVRPAGQEYGMISYFRPGDFPQAYYGWTPREAWDRFLTAQRHRLEDLQADVARIEANIATAEKAREQP